MLLTADPGKKRQDQSRTHTSLRELPKANRQTQENETNYRAAAPTQSPYWIDLCNPKKREPSARFKLLIS